MNDLDVEHLERKIVALKTIVESMAETYNRQVTELREMIHERVAAFERKFSERTEAEGRRMGTENGAAAERAIEEMLESAVRRRDAHAVGVQSSCGELIRALKGLIDICEQMMIEENKRCDASVLDGVHKAAVKLDCRFNDLTDIVARVGTLRHALGRIKGSS